MPAIYDAITDLCENVHQITRSLDFTQANRHYPDSMELQRVVIDTARTLHEVEHQWDGEWIECCESIGGLISAGSPPTREQIENIIGNLAAERPAGRWSDEKAGK